MERETSTTLFTSKSDYYARFRPGYPDETFDIILNRFKYCSGTKVVDVGAGTGISSRLLAKNGVSVIGIEPNGEMISSAKPHEGVTYKYGKAEFLPFKDNHADLVTSFQAFHWFDFKKSLKEFNRILKPSGRLALVWSYWDHSNSFTKAYAMLINNAADKNPNLTSPYQGILTGKIKKIRMSILWRFKYLPFFSNVKRQKLQYVQEVNLENLIGCAYSQSCIPHEGSIWNNLIREIESLYSDHNDPELIYTTNVFIADPVKRK